MTEELHRLKITCPNGLVHNTRLEVDGKTVDGVTRVELSLDATTGITTAVLHVERVEVDLAGADAVFTEPRTFVAGAA